MQNAARNRSIQNLGKNPNAPGQMLPNVPNGLAVGGLDIIGSPTGALAPTQSNLGSGVKVTVKQTAAQALLNWKTFNIGKKTVLEFNQKAGGSDAGKWTVFNRVTDPSGAPSQIMGAIRAEGQVYVINQNGIIFGPGSQVNTRTFVASALPINENLLKDGLLNNRDAQFLFSALSVPGGSDGTPVFTPSAPLTPNGRSGDVIVQAGAMISSAANSDGNGGRVMLVGANVRNEGIISTPSGQAILAAGLQVGIQAHDQDDPSLRGLDVWVGDVGTYGGTVTNTGLIESLTGSILMTGKNVEQFGVLESTTSVNLNGRIDLLASYGAVSNPTFDNTGGAGTPFVYQYTGSVTFGEGSVTRILPDYLSEKSIPGTKLPESSQVYVEGLTIRLASQAILMAPSGEINFRAGEWPYKDKDGDRTTAETGGTTISRNYFDGTKQKFLLSKGQIYLEADSLIDVSGTTDVFVPLLQYLVAVQMRGSELADSPLQRDGDLRGAPLIVDLRRTGTYYGREWVGTPLGDLTGLAGIIQRNVAQLTAAGGNVNLAAGGSIVTQAGSTIDVSGGYYVNEGGVIKTSRLLRGGNVVDISEATPDQIYNGIYMGQSTERSVKWGVSETFAHPLSPLDGYNQKEYIEGAAGGTINLAAPNMALGGNLVGQTVKGPKQLEAPPKLGTIEIAFRGEKQVASTTGQVLFVPYSPTPPVVLFENGTSSPDVPKFELANGEPASLPDGLRQVFSVSTDIFDENKGGFGHLKIENMDGEAVITSTVHVPVGGSLSVSAANITVDADIVAPGGDIVFTAYNYSPFLLQELKATGVFSSMPAPAPVEGRGVITVNPGVRMSVAGMIVDERETTNLPGGSYRLFDAGSIKLEGYSVLLAEGSVLDASGGVLAKAQGKFEYGDGGSIAILAGKDPGLATTVGGRLEIGSKLLGYSGATGATLAIQANLIQIGGGGASADSNMLVLQPEFFRQGGFTRYSLTGIGAPGAAPGEYIPGVRIVAGTVIQPVAESYLAQPFRNGDGTLGLQTYLKPVGERVAASIDFAALGYDDPFTTAVLEARGDVVMEAGASIITDPLGEVTMDGQTVTVLGSITAPGGLISISGAKKYPRPSEELVNATFALPTVYIGPTARLSAAGTVVYLDDPFGRRNGIVYAGGTISVAGNIVADSGAVLDVSGASAMLDIHPSRLAMLDSLLNIPLNSGVTSIPWGRLSVPVRIDSDGGLIDLEGGEMLLSDATLRGFAGGPSATGGTLSVSSGRFYVEGAPRTSADINLVVTQSGNVIPAGNATRGVGIAVLGADGAAVAGMGYFSVDRFTEGGFDSLDLGYKFFEDATPLPFGGNVKFVGPVSINARGFLRVAGGGVLEANAPVTLTAPYVAVGQAFRAPLNPDDQLFPFTQDPIPADGTRQYFLPPTTGSGNLAINADLIDVGTLSLQGIGGAIFSAVNGDIRGNGTLDIAGELTLIAAQVYPTTLAKFDIFAYDKNVKVASSSTASNIVTLASSVLPPGFGVGSPLLGSIVQSINGAEITLEANANAAISNRWVVYAPGSGSVTIVGAGSSPTPLSAGGTLRIFASNITQGGVLHAPLGSIVLGWDGTDTDPSDADIDPPLDSLTGSTFAVPIADKVTLKSGSFTSVAAIDRDGNEMLIPFGLSSDGLSWIDPRGVNVTVSGLPAKNISIAGNNVVTESGSVLDIRGGGDLYAYRWVAGTGGSIDILGSPSVAWSPSGEYEAGTLVSYQGQTWSARVAIDPDDFAAGSPAPRPSRYWTLVPESYAIIPSFEADYAPYAPFNTGSNAGSLAGDPGYVSGSLQIGDQIYLGASPGLAAGTYTLLPKRYALLPGAFLVTPQSGDPVGTLTMPDGASYVSGYQFNAFNQSAEVSPVLSKYEVASSGVVRSRAEYADYLASSFMTEAADRLDIAEPQRLPGDAGYLSFQGNTAMNIQGAVLADFAAGSRGAMVDISSFADIYLVGGSGTAPNGATVVISTALLNSWGVESLLIGGLRRETSDGTVVDVRTGNITLDNAGSTFAAPEIILASRGKLTLVDGASIASTGRLSQPAQNLLITGDGTLLRVSGDPTAAITRTGLTGSSAPLMTIGGGVRIGGTSVILDSTYGTNLDPTASISARALTLGSGQISIVFDDASGALTGSVVDPHLILEGDILDKVQQVGSLTLKSYSMIDVYGTGTFGGDSLSKLNLLGGGIRGYEQGSGTVTFQAESILFDNPSKVAAPVAPSGAPTGSVVFDAEMIRLGTNNFSVAGYQNTTLQASAAILGQGAGNFSTPGNLTVITPLITGTGGSTHGVTAGGTLEMLSTEGETQVRESGLGAAFTFTGTTVLANTNIILPSGQITLHATTGDVTVGGNLNVDGTFKRFYDIIRYSDAGSILLKSDLGDVSLLGTSTVSVSGNELGGNAGSLAISATAGRFSSEGTLRGNAIEGYRSGSFALDAGMIESFAETNALLNAGDFFESRNFRVRNGDITVDGVTEVRNFALSVDKGSINVVGTIDASGETGGTIALAARDNVTIASTARLTVAAEHFNNAGKGGEVRIEAGVQSDGAINTGASLDIQTGSVIDLSVADYVAGDYKTAGSSTFFGQFTGTLHLRAPRVGNGVNIAAISGDIVGASSILVEAYRLYDLTGNGTMNIALRDSINADNAAFINASESSIRSTLLSGNAGLDSVLVVAPGVEIINRSGDLTLGQANTTGSTSNDARSTADWDLSSWRYGSRSAPGVLTLRASGDLVFNNTLSDGFTPVAANANNGWSSMWLAQLMTINNNLPVNTQSWSYRLSAGADLGAADFQAVRSVDSLQAGKGSILVGEFYAAVPNSFNTGSAAGIGSQGQTADSIRIATSSTDTTNRGTRFEVIRTGTGNISVNAGRDVQLRNQFATIYTGGVAIADPTSVFQTGDFSAPPTTTFISNPHPSLGTKQQAYTPQWAMAGGNLSVTAGANIGHYTRNTAGVIVADSTRQIPNNWLYRRGYVDPATGLFASYTIENLAVTDTSASTTWWVDYSNFFQSFGALGGGNVNLTAGNDIVNADAVAPTNARMAGKDPVTGKNLAPDDANLLEYGGGDVTVTAGNNIDGGVYYVERGNGKLSAGGEIKTNSARSLSLGSLSSSSETLDSSTWMPTMLFLGRGSFDVSARKDVLLGPVTNVFLLPQGLNNGVWNKTYFNTYGADSSVNVSSFGGSVTHRLAVTLPTEGTAKPILQAWLERQNVYSDIRNNTASHYQPWLRLAETNVSIDPFSTATTIMAPTLRSTAFAGDVRIVGTMNLFPSATGTIELAAAGGIIGLNPSGITRTLVDGVLTNVTAWTSARINLSDANPASIPGVTNPFGYLSASGFVPQNIVSTQAAFLPRYDLSFAETGSFSGNAGSIEVKRDLHSTGLLHAEDKNPLRLFAQKGDITGLTLYSPKFSAIVAGRDITDIAFYLQNVSANDITLVSAGRDIIPYNENSPLRSLATDISRGNLVVDAPHSTVLTNADNSAVTTTALAGDIQISGEGVLEVLAGRNLDLGTGANFTDGTGVGITSIGNSRNPFLPFAGASIVALAGVEGRDGGAAFGLSNSTLNIEEFITQFIGSSGENLEGVSPSEFASLTPEGRGLVSLTVFYQILRFAAAAYQETGSYDIGYAAIEALFGSGSYQGEIFTRARDIRTVSGGSILLAAPGGGLTLASAIFGNPLTPPGIVTEYGGAVNVYTRDSVDIGQARIFTLRGGDLTIWSTTGDIAAGTAPKTVVTAPPTRVIVDASTADVKTDLGGLATGGGIGVLASVEGVEEGSVFLIAPEGAVDAGDAGIRSTGTITLAAAEVRNADNISAPSISGAPTAAAPAAPNIPGLNSGSNAAGAATSAMESASQQAGNQAAAQEPAPSIITVEVLGYGGGGGEGGYDAGGVEREHPTKSDDEEEKRKKKNGEDSGDEGGEAVSL